MNIQLIYHLKMHPQFETMDKHRLQFILKKAVSWYELFLTMTVMISHLDSNVRASSL